MADDWITTNEAIELTRYNADYLRRLIRNEKVTAKKFGRTWMVSKSSLLDYLKLAQQSEDHRYRPKSGQSN